MKRFFIVALLIQQSWGVFSQNTFDSIPAFFKEFHLSAEVGYNYLLPSAAELHRQSDRIGFYYSIGIPDSKYYHHQWNIAIAAESKIAKWRLSLERDYLDYKYYEATFDADYLCVALSLQFFILKCVRMHVLLGPAIELGWITRYNYTSNGVTLHNPDIGQTTGINLLFPLTLSYRITNRNRIYIQVAGGLHLQDDHELPQMTHWGAVGPGPEASLQTSCPFSIGTGYSFSW